MDANKNDQLAIKQLAINELADALTSLFNAVYQDMKLYETYNNLHHPDIEDITAHTPGLSIQMRRAMNKAYHTVHNYSK